MNAGDTFLFPGGDDHLWMIISDPARDAEHVVIVRFLSWKTYNEQTCVLHAGDHPFVKHDTCVDYRDAKVTTAQQLFFLEGEGRLKRKEALSADVLARIRECVGASRIPLGIEDLLRAQDVIA